MKENFRQFLDRLRQAGELVDLHQAVDIRHIATLVDQAKTALFFHNVIGYKTPVVSGIVRSKEPHMPTADMFKERWKNHMKVWDATLGRQKYAAGNEVTIADFSLYAGWARAKGAIAECCVGFPNVDRWAAEMAARPAIQRALKF